MGSFKPSLGTLPLELKHRIVKELYSDPKSLLTIRLVLRLGMEPLRPYFNNFSITVKPDGVMETERLLFAMNDIPASWMTRLHVMGDSYLLGNVFARPGKPYYDRVPTRAVFNHFLSWGGAARNWLCLECMPWETGREILSRMAYRIPTIYLILPDESPEDGLAKWLDCIMTVLPRSIWPEKISAGWGWVPETLPLEQIAKLQAAGVKCEPA